MENYNIWNDIEVIKIMNNNELSKYSIETYYYIIKQFTECLNKPYFEIINEIKNLQRDKIIGNEIIKYNPNDSLINEYIHKYIHFLVQNGNKNSTINFKLKTLLILLRKSNIETPKINLKPEPTQTKVQLITTDDIKYILNNSNIHHQAMFTFMSSMGGRRYDIINTFDVGFLMNSCSDYIKTKSVDEFLEEAPSDMIPYFEFVPHKTQKTGLPCKCCCSNESTNLMIESLKLRQKSIERHNKIYNDDLKLTEESPLFASKKRSYLGKYDDASVSGIFHTKNKLLKEYKVNKLKEQLQNNQITKQEYKIKIDKLPKFHPHSLRHRFISTLRAYTTNRDISLIMEGHASSIATDKFYVGESEELFNKDIIKETYLKVMPYLTFGIGV